MPGRWDTDTDGHSNTYCYGDNNGFRHSNAETDAHTKDCADTEASSNTAAETVVYRGLGSTSVLIAPSGILPDGPLPGCVLNDDGTTSYELFERFG